MTMPISMDLRERAMARLAKGESVRQGAAACDHRLGSRQGPALFRAAYHSGENRRLGIYLPPDSTATLPGEYLKDHAKVSLIRLNRASKVSSVPSDKAATRSAR